MSTESLRLSVRGEVEPLAAATEPKISEAAKALLQGFQNDWKKNAER
jgi:hypothetical protein